MGERQVGRGEGASKDVVKEVVSKVNRPGKGEEWNGS